MWGYLIWHEEPCRLRLWEQTIGGVRFLTAEICRPENFWQRRRLHRMMKKIFRAGVRQIVRGGSVPEGLPERFGLSAVDVSPLRQALLPKLLDWAEKAWGLSLRSCCVRLHASRTDRAVWRCAAVLARRARYLELDTGEGSEALADDLRRRYGLSCGGRPVLEICLAQGWTGDVPALLLGRDCGRMQKMRWYMPGHGEMPEELLAALYREGRLEEGTPELGAVESRA